MSDNVRLRGTISIQTLHAARVRLSGHFESNHGVCDQVGLGAQTWSKLSLCDEGCGGHVEYKHGTGKPNGLHWSLLGQVGVGAPVLMREQIGFGVSLWTPARNAWQVRLYRITF